MKQLIFSYSEVYLNVVKVVSDSEGTVTKLVKRAWLHHYTSYSLNLEPPCKQNNIHVHGNWTLSRSGY